MYEVIVEDIDGPLKNIIEEKTLINWFLLGVGLGITGNILVSSLIEFILLNFKENWQQIIFFLLLGSVFLTYYVFQLFYKRMKQLELLESGFKDALNHIRERISFLENQTCRN